MTKEIGQGDKSAVKKYHGNMGIHLHHCFGGVQKNNINKLVHR